MNIVVCVVGYIVAALAVGVVSVKGGFLDAIMAGAAMGYWSWELKREVRRRIG